MPPLTDPWSNAAPGRRYMFRAPLSVPACATVNVNLAAQPDAIIDGVDLSGFDYTANVLLTGQTVPSQNGPYSTDSDLGDPLTGVTLPSVLNGSGSAQITGLTPGKLYYVTGDPGIGVTNGTATVPDINAIPAMMAPTAGGILTLSGPANGSLSTLFVAGSRWVRDGSYNGSDEWPELNRFIVANGTANKGEWVCTTPLPIVIGTTALTFTKRLAVPATI